ncbi:hypothetical protein DINM_020756 [Dirofilaria immitis]|nr:hypothetical protein [Dirofilaria immitis]
MREISVGLNQRDENFSAKECNVQDQENGNTENEKEMKKQKAKKSSEAEDSSKEEATEMSQVEKRLTNLSSKFPISTITMRQETTPKKEVEKSPRILQIQRRLVGLNSAVSGISTKQEISLKSEIEKSPSISHTESYVTLDRSGPIFQFDDASMKQETKPKKEMEKKDAKSDMREKPKSINCPNCQVMRSEVSTLTAKLKELEAKTKMESPVKSNVRMKVHNSSEVDDEENDEWKARCVGLNGALKIYNEITGDFEKLTESIKAIQEETVQQIRAFELKIEENMNERDILLAKLSKAQEKTSSMNDMLGKQREKNLKLSNVAQNVQQKTIDEFEKEKEELIRTSEANLAVTEQLYRSSQLKEIQEDGQEGIWSSIREKMSAIMEKFKTESNDSDFAWMEEEDKRYIIDSFEVAIKIILENEPRLESLAERLLDFIESKNRRRKPAEPSYVDEENSPEAKAFKDFKAELNAEIRLMLENFHAKQAEELSRNICEIMEHMENAEQKFDDKVVKRIDNLGDLLLGVDQKQDDLQMTETKINSKLQALSEAIGDLGNKVIMENESRATEMENFSAEKHDMRAGLVYAEHLGSQQMNFETRLRNLEKEYKKLANPTFDQPRVYMREESSRSEIDYSDMVEWPPRHWSSSGFKQEETRKDQQIPVQYGAARETAEGELTILGKFLFSSDEAERHRTSKEQQKALKNFSNEIPKMSSFLK